MLRNKLRRITVDAPTHGMPGLGQLNVVLRGVPPSQPRRLLVGGLFRRGEVGKLTKFVAAGRRVSTAGLLEQLVVSHF
jgi:hypothetical protein